MRRYARMLDQALEQRIYKSASNSADGLREMAEDLGFLRAGPRDIIEIHVACLDRIVNSAPSPRAQAYVEEARIAVLELMGHLAAYYRNFYSGRYRREVRK